MTSFKSSLRDTLLKTVLAFHLKTRTLTLAIKECYIAKYLDILLVTS